MNRRRIRVDVICGGQSMEHEISVVSAVSIINGLMDGTAKHIIHAVYITKKGGWFRSEKPLSGSIESSDLTRLEKKGIRVFPSADPDRRKYFVSGAGELSLPDIYFPVLHGTKGEDGVIQGLFDLMNIPYVGSGVTGGMCGMDKSVMRTLFRAEGLPVLPWLTVTREEWHGGREKIRAAVKSKLKYPVFVKPSNLGSSVGITKVKNPGELDAAMKAAFLYGSKAVVEEGRAVREIECAILGNEQPEVSVTGEIIPGAEFYDYNDKYHGKKAGLKIPADITKTLSDKIRGFALRAFRAVNARGLSRADFFICKKTGELYINEINTFPGFTSVSMYPKLWEYSGISFRKLLDKLICLGFENHEREQGVLLNFIS